MNLLQKLIVTAIVALASTSKLQAEIQTEVVLEGLISPTGVAVQPEAGTVFVAESGAQQIIRVVEGKKETVVENFPKDEYGKGPTYQIGPLGLAFINKNTLVVGDGSLPDGEEVIRVYTVPDNGEKVDASDAKHISNPLIAEDEMPGEGNFFGVAIDQGVIFATANGDDKQGWVAKLTVEKDGFGKLVRFIPTKQAVEVDAPAAITISPRREIVVGQMGEINDSKDSLLTFYDQESKEIQLSLNADLHDLVGLAYSPQTGRLYAVDYSWANPKEGGLYRLDSVRREGKQVVKATKLLDLDQPTSMAFAPSGELYICVFANGDAADTTKTPATGKLLKIAEGL